MTFTDAELEYLSSQRLGRLATVASDGTLQNNPVSFRYNPETATIDIGGHGMGASRKFRNVLAGGEVAFVIDDIASVQPWKVRGVEIRGHGEALADQPPPGPGFSGELIRVRPRRILSWGLDPAVQGMQARTVEAAR
ncbi:MAG: pyridoxamine 5-phosphate oxidase family protein [Streptosporangiaceae bacterium]|jgi:pyridoxamine 5'-phosphate oxidase family protein|nr:pyridoxamine 5-phosphate oxidase [Streptosporangiaceae bacterium]MDX6433481.1 pyridoxamine 5-phosphate oxidase family protein [Streptosporangiaceae bacterium]